jgi:hypothetical protein
MAEMAQCRTCRCHPAQQSQGTSRRRPSRVSCFGDLLEMQATRGKQLERKAHTLAVMFLFSTTQKRMPQVL